MKTSLQISTLIILSAISLFSYADDDYNYAKKLLDAGSILPLETILQKARKTHSGKILEIELEKEDNQLVYEIELLTSDGKVVELLFDAKTGSLISKEEED
jgi:uncharacterized membrane protein YkoI